MGKIPLPAAGVVTIEKLNAFLYIETYKISVSQRDESSGT